MLLTPERNFLKKTESTVDGLNCGSPKDMFMSWHPEPVNMILLETGPLRTGLRSGNWNKIIRDYSGGPKSKDKCPGERQKRRRHAHGTKSVRKTKTERDCTGDAWSTRKRKRQRRLLLQNFGGEELWSFWCFCYIYNVTNYWLTTPTFQSTRNQIDVRSLTLQRLHYVIWHPDSGLVRISSNLISTSWAHVVPYGVLGDLSPFQVDQLSLWDKFLTLVLFTSLCLFNARKDQEIGRKWNGT